MEFSNIVMDRVQPVVRDRYIRDVVILQKLLGLSSTVFEKAYFAEGINLECIQNALEGEKIGDSRRTDYLRSVCALLSALYVEHDGLKKLMYRYSSLTISVRERPELPIDDLKDYMEGESDPIVKVMCAMLVYNVGTDISSMLRSTIDVDGSEYNLDTKTLCWHLGKACRPICSDFAVYVTSIIRGSSGRFTLYNLSKVSRMFKSATGHNYSDYRRPIKKMEKASNPIVHHQTHESTPLIGVSWVHLQSLNIIEIHLKNIRSLSERLGISSGYYDEVYYNDIMTIERIRDLTGLSTNTLHNMVTSVCVVMDRTAGRLYNEYTVYRMELELLLTRENLGRLVPWFPNIYMVN